MTPERIASERCWGSACLFYFDWVRANRLPGFLPYATEDVVSGVVLFPFRTFAMLAGLVTISAVSRLTGTKWPPKQFN